MGSEDEVLRRHGYHRLGVKRVVAETVDASTIVLEVPDGLRRAFDYRAGQFCSFRVRVDGEEHARCYSMSSAPETDGDLAVTVKRVPGGTVSNWLVDHVAAGDHLEVTRPAGTFCVRPLERPIVALCGGSGITPVLSIAKSVLASSQRPVDLLYANRYPTAVIFAECLGALQRRYPGRLAVRHHVDTDGGYLDRAAVEAFVAGRRHADFYVCGPDPFMELVEGTLLGLGVEADAIAIERFVPPAPPEPAALPEPAAPDPAGAHPASIVVTLKGRTTEVAYRVGDTVLETARRAGLGAPYSCEAGNCATCMALVRDGAATMRANNALTDDEVEEGWILTCQAQPTGSSFAVEYEAL